MVIFHSYVSLPEGKLADSTIGGLFLVEMMVQWWTFRTYWRVYVSSIYPPEFDVKHTLNKTKTR